MNNTPPHQIRCRECDQPMTWRSGNITWTGDWERNTYVYECANACLVSAEVTYSIFVPLDVAQARGTR